jgi:vacuolar-type H+-ATPase subunit I/STV1
MASEVVFVVTVNKDGIFSSKYAILDTSCRAPTKLKAIQLCLSFITLTKTYGLPKA